MGGLAKGQIITVTVKEVAWRPGRGRAEGVEGYIRRGDLPAIVESSAPIAFGGGAFDARSQR